MNTTPVRVFLIEDDPEDVARVRKALAKAPGIQFMRTHGTGLADGLKVLATQKVGVLLLDLDLPDSRGLETLKSIRDAFPKIPVLVLGGPSDDGLPVEAIKLGAQDYLAKGELSGPMLTRAVRYAIERGQAKSALRGGAELFRNVYQEAPIGIVLTSREGKFISANPAFCRMLGYTVEEVGRMTFLDVTHPDDRSNNRHNVENMWQGKLPHYRTEKRYIAKNGDTRWGGLSSSLIRDGDGRPLYAMAMVEDITERKHAEELLKHGEERYKLMFDSAPLAINITRGTEITYANPSYLKMFGFSNLDELKSRAPVDLFTPESRPRILKNIQRRAKGLPVPESYEAQCLRKDGTRFPALMHLTRTMFADGPATVAFVMDITERQRAEIALKQSEEKFRLLSERSQVGIYIMQDARMAYVNPAFAEMFGYAPEEVMSLPSPQDLLRPADLEKGRRRLQDELGGHDGDRLTTFSGTRKDGAIVEIEARGALIDYGGRPAVLGTAMDVTERKRAQVLQDAVYRIGNATLTTGSLHDLYAEIHHVISQVMNAQNFYIALYDEERDLLTFPYFKDAADEIYVDEVHPEKGLTAYVLRTGASLLCTQAVHDELERRGEVKLLGAPSSIWLGVPLSIEGKTIGAIVVQHYSDPAAYGEREQHMLEFVSAQIAVAIERKRAEEAVRLRADELAALNATVLEITAPHDLKALLQTIVERAAQLLGAPGGGMYLCDPVHKEVRCVVSYHTPQDFTGTILKYGEGAAGTVALTGEPLMIDDYRVWGQRAASFEERQPFWLY